MSRGNIVIYIILYDSYIAIYRHVKAIQLSYTMKLYSIASYIYVTMYRHILSIYTIIWFISRVVLARK